MSDNKQFKWKHKCSLAWMRARQSYLTASEIRELVPLTKTGRKRTIDDATYTKMWARKHHCIRQEDCLSYDAAARGHILEPYAVEAFNQATGFRMYHWDDALVVNNYGTLAFSPDAMDIPQPTGLGVEVDCNPGSILEVKSYGAERHCECGRTEPGQLEERWQVACAMTVKPSIAVAYICFFNPSMEEQLYWARYDREDLSDEIEAILEAYRGWQAFAQEMEDGTNQPRLHCRKGDPGLEDMIVESLESADRMNP